uniref:DUF8039 domain-containing protein n=1 Tax=Oryza sativa subsp. japonica TaxID=39947 RepID=Q6UU76_ORYSJ|nr:hypothetical protein OSJNBa0023H09.21 [Oryza sativa Japonica Group]
MLEMFTLPAGTENIVKQWTLKKMAEQFQSFKGDLYKKYILKGLTLNFDVFPKLRDHWDEFIAYKTGQQGQAMMDRNKENTAKKKYHHHLGSGGYSVAMPKWEEMEASIIERGIEQATAKWPYRSKFWYYAHEKDELSLALQTPEHPGQTRGKGVVPWKIGFKEDIHTYRSRMRSKRDTEAKIADLEYRVSSYEARGGGKEGNRSSCASTGQVGSQSMDAMQTQDETTCPVDEITQRTPCELHIPFKNLSIKVALEMAIPTDPSGTYHCRPVPAGYSRVEVELVEAAYEDLELDYPGGDGETHLRDTSHAIILWRKRYIILPRRQAASRAPSPPAPPSPPPPPPAPSPSAPPAPPPPLCPPAPLKTRSRQAPPPARTRATKKAKVDATKNKESPYDCSQEELNAYVAGEVKRQLKPRSPEKKIPVDPSVKNLFKKMSTTNKEMYKFHERYMEMSAKGREMFGARIRNSDFLQGEDVLWIHFKDVFELYPLDTLDVSLLSALILMEIKRARRWGVYDTGFIDPRKINAEMIDKYEKDIEDNLVHLLTQQHFKTFILLPYNTE